jgi:hypothetical protein
MQLIMWPSRSHTFERRSLVDTVSAGPRSSSTLACVKIRLEHVVADELKQADTTRKGQRWGEQSVGSDAKRRRILESKLAEASALEGLTDVRGQVGRMTMAGPDHGGLRRTKPRKMADGVGDVLRRYVAEHTAQENQVRRDGALIRIRHRGIGDDDFNSVKPCALGGAAREQRIVLVKLDQASCDIRAPRMLGKDADQVVSLSAQMLIARAEPGALRSSAARTCACTTARRLPSAESGSVWSSCQVRQSTAVREPIAARKTEGETP